MKYTDLDKYNIEQIQEYYTEYLREHNEKFYSSVQPYTFSEFMEQELEKCAMCEEWELKDNMIDTEGMVNGGISYVCPSCKEDM